MRRLLPAALILLLLVACSGEGKPPPEPLVFTGSDGVSVSFQTPPKRIVSLAPHATEIICQLGAGESLVAVDESANCPLVDGTKPHVGVGNGVQTIVSFEPDLVYSSEDRGGMAQSLRSAGLNVLIVSAPGSLAGIFDNIETLGRLTGKDKEALALTAQMKARQNDITEEVEDVTVGPSFFHQLGSDLSAVRANSLTAELYALLKAVNVAERAAAGSARLTPEAVAGANPEVIVVSDGASVESVKARAGWSAIKAVQDERICAVDGELTGRPGPRIMEGLNALYECLYEEKK